MAEMRLRVFQVILPLVFLSLASGATLAQEPFLREQRAAAVPMPTAEDIAKAQQKAREALERVPSSGMNQAASPSVPKVDAIPKPAAPSPDIASIAEKYRHLGQQPAQGGGKADLLVFVSLSMPREALVRAAEQAERAGATLVFRGLKGDSMMKMGEEIQSIIGNRNVPVAIHPPAFQQFSVTRVPAVVLARSEASNVLDNGCAKTDTFVKVSGDVSLDYALDYIERKSPAWAAEARGYRSKIVRGIN
ncbi:type-F conjugative transfer system pilin assembly protein TrbC [Thiobacter aerophilum]|uniref:Type-F conjugative transfer system pilin assembly protein TrbC n=1 Tax=Thiobacter aerophilum TaxID=3121275 RepID=A0ABV0EIW5_9BURK